eukprot:119292_1
MMAVPFQQSSNDNDDDDDDDTSQCLSLGDETRYNDNASSSTIQIATGSLADLKEKYEIGDRIRSSDTLRGEASGLYAIKRIFFDGDEETLRSFVQVQQSLNQAGITTTYGVYRDKYHLYRVSDRYKVCSVSDMIEVHNHKGGMDEDDVRYMMSDIVPQIHALHNIGHVHGDICPNKLLYDINNGDYRIINYNATEYVGKRTQCIESYFTGTLGFTAPEFVDYEGMSNTVTCAVDVWSLGLCIFYCITGGQMGELELKYEDEFSEWHYDLFDRGWMIKAELSRLYDRCMISQELYHLLKDGLLVIDPQKRMTTDQILKHPWFKDHDDDDEDNEAELDLSNQTDD